MNELTSNGTLIIWEAGVKSVKHQLRRVLGLFLHSRNSDTILIQIEAILNSRPITPISDHINDLQALTMGNFLIVKPMNTVSDPCLPGKVSPLRRWHLLQQVTHHFWNRWNMEYFTKLQQRYNWMKPSENISIGALVLIKDETTPPTKRPIGRIIDTHPGGDGLVQVVTIKTQSGSLKRPVNKLIIVFQNATE